MRPLRGNQEGRVFEPTTLAAKRGPCDQSAAVRLGAGVAAKVARIRRLVRTAAAQEQGRASGKTSRPSPIPECFRVMEESAWVNERKIS
jgi:hypothetical protein